MTNCCDLLDISVPIRLANSLRHIVNVNGTCNDAVTDITGFCKQPSIDHYKVEVDKNVFMRMNNQNKWIYDIGDFDKVSFYSQEEA